MKILILASSTNAVLLKELVLLSRSRGDGIEWSVIIGRAPYLHLFDDVIPPELIFYLYENFNEEFSRAPKGLSLSNSEDNVARILASDKDGYRNESGEFQERALATMLTVYREVLDRVRPDAALFLPLETVDGIALLALCQERKITPLHTVHMRHLGETFFSTSMYEKLPPYFGICNDADREKARRFIDEFLAGQRGAGDMPEGLSCSERASYPRRRFLHRVVHAIWTRSTKERHYRGEDRLLLRIKTNMLGPLYMWRRFRYRLTRNHLFDILPERGNFPERFIVYAAQVSPESSINTLAQFFVDQERAIDLLRMTMPHGYSLVVKEHPSMAGSRPRSFYRRLHRLPGVLLASPDVSMKTLIEKADIVATITGTVGLEAFLLGKPCLMFGHSFFSHLCCRVDSLDGLKEDMERLLTEFRPPLMEEKVEAVAKFYNVSFSFAVFEPYYRPEVLARDNVSNFLDALHIHVKKLRDCNAAASPGAFRS